MADNILNMNAVDLMRQYASQCDANNPDVAKVVYDFADLVDSEYVTSSEYNSVIQQRDSVQAQHNAVLSQIQAISDERDTAKSECARAKAETAALRTESRNLRDSVQTLTAENSSIKESSEAALAAERENTRNICNELTNENQSLQNVLELEQERNRSLQADNDTLTSNMALLQTKYDYSTQQVEDFTKLTDEMSERTDDYGAKIIRLSDSIRSLRSTIDTLTKERNTAIQERDTAKTRLQEIASQYKSAISKTSCLDVSQADYDALSARTLNLETALKEAEATSAKWQERANTAETESKSARSDMKLAVSRENAIRQELINVCNERDAAKSQAETIVNDNEAKKIDYDHALMVERGKFNASLRIARRKLIDAGVNLSIINVAFAGLGTAPSFANGESVNPEEDERSQEIIDHLLNETDNKTIKV